MGAVVAAIPAAIIGYLVYWVLSFLFVEGTKANLVSVRGTRVDVLRNQLAYQRRELTTAEGLASKALMRAGLRVQPSPLRAER